jgi:multidrug efflux system membrane fusion protein
MRTPFLTLSLALLSAAALTGCGKKQEEQKDIPPIVDIATVQPYEGAVPTNQYSATVVPDSEVDVAFKVGGYITSISQRIGADGKPRDLQGGDTIRRGEELAQVRRVDYANPVDLSQAQLDQSQSTVSQRRSALNQATAQQQTALAALREAQSARDTAQAQLDNAEASKRQAEAQLKEAEAGVVQTQAQLVSQEATRTETKLAFDRTTNLYGTGSATKPEMDTATANYDVARARVDQAHAQIAELQAKAEAARQQIAAAQASIDAARSQLDVNQAKIEGAQSQVAAARAAIGSARAQLTGAQAGVKGAQAQLAGNRLPLNDTRLLAPWDGLIIKRLTDVGAFVQPGTAVFTLADTAQVKAVFGIPDTALGRVRLGSFQTITADALPGIRFRNQVTQISPAADPRSRVFQVEVTIPNPNRRLSPGMIVTATIGGPAVAQGTRVIPMGAVVPDPNRTGVYSVYVVEGQRESATVKPREVKLGRIFGDQIELLGGLQPNERFVASGPTLLHDGQQVQVVSELPSSEDARP